MALGLVAALGLTQRARRACMLRVAADMREGEALKALMVEEARIRLSLSERGAWGHRRSEARRGPHIQ